VLFVGRDDRRIRALAGALSFFAPEAEQVSFPAWDCLPYDRLPPHADIAGRRVEALARLLGAPMAGGGGRVILTTVAAACQRVPPRDFFRGASLEVRAGGRLEPADLIKFLAANGYARVDMVMEPGEYAVRGGIIDVFAPASGTPARLDFFADEVERLRLFDAQSQRTTGETAAWRFQPVSEVLLNAAAIERFRTSYRQLFGSGEKDPLYEAVSSGRRRPGMEHWLPLFHPTMETIFDYAAEATVVLDIQADEALEARLDMIAEYYAARVEVMNRAGERAGDRAGGAAKGGDPYRPLPPQRLYLDRAAWDNLLVDISSRRGVIEMTSFDVPFDISAESSAVVDLGGRPGEDFAAARVAPEINLFDALAERIGEHQKAGRRVVVAGVSEGSLERLAGVMGEHGIGPLAKTASMAAAGNLGRDTTALAVLDLEHGFTAPGLAVICESDILGERAGRPRKSRVTAENFIAEASQLAAGDLVVHADHGIGRFEGLETVEVAGAPHDCLRLVYGGGDRLFLPVENIEVLGRYGSEDAAARLDRLGGAAWQARKSKLKQRIRDMAEELIKVAAVRALKPVAKLPPCGGLYDEFAAAFPFSETEDQARAIDDVVEDLAGSRPADRLICGDVGFGKTEVALRAAFIATFAGKQVAVMVPTTLLCRQHYRTFKERFAGYPVRIGQLSRLVAAKDAKLVKEGIADGGIDIVIGTHALLAGDLRFRDLGLLVIDEEQHFGVAHKEKLKKLRADVHVITLTATPIPRTLQLALAGVKDMSLIATPPVDRLAVRTFVLPFDPVVIGEAVRRERYRGGQTFYVCPRISDLGEVRETLAELAPDISVVTAHGRLPASELEDSIGAFYDGKYDLLLSTNIIESGLDLPRVNTIIIHRADRFGLAQLYQLRGRVGRSKARAYAYLTLPRRHALSAAATKRLEVMQTLDSLGAGFSLASHDLDIRGAGNLLGGEQSGHIREVGIELYQQMLEEAVAEARGLETADEDWSPGVAIGLAVLIPETYVADLTLRMDLYRRLARLTEKDEIEAFAGEIIDRFGSLPEEVENLLRTVEIKGLAKAAGVEKVDAGPKGAVISFRDNDFANPAGLVDFITKQTRGRARLRPDHKLVVKGDWGGVAERARGVRRLLEELAEIAGT
jgi:transcription-repair coupling factor (superfamily II helicase)